MENRYFSVFADCNIRGNRFVPGVCYPVKTSIAHIIEDMEKHQEARIYREKMVFVTGVPCPARPGAHRQGGLPPSPSGSVSAGVSPRGPDNSGKA